MKQKNIQKSLFIQKLFKNLDSAILIISPIMIILSCIFFNNSFMRVLLIISICTLVISLVLLPFLIINYGEMLAMKKMHDLITKDGILLIPQLSAIFGNGDFYAKTIINKLIAGKYLLNYAYKNQDELKRIEEIKLGK